MVVWETTKSVSLFLMSRKLLSTTMELFRVVWVFVRRAKNKMQGVRGSTCKTSKPFVLHVFHLYQWAAIHYTTHFESLNSINYLTRLRRAGCLRGRLWVARRTNPSDGGPTATCQRCFFCFCFVLFLQLSTMNFLPRDGLFQIKMTGIIKHFFNVQRCGLSWLARSGSLTVKGRSAWGDKGNKCIWAGKKYGNTPWYYITACRKTNSVLWRTLNPRERCETYPRETPRPK